MRPEARLHRQDPPKGSGVGVLPGKLVMPRAAGSSMVFSGQGMCVMRYFGAHAIVLLGTVQLYQLLSVLV